jgi:hypothetical protein
VGPWFRAWMACTVIAAVLFVVAVTRSVGGGECIPGSVVSTYDAAGVPAEGCVVAGSGDRGAWEIVLWGAGAAMGVGIAGSVLSALRFAERAVGRATVDAGGPDLAGQLRDLADVVDGGARRPGGPTPPPDGSAPPPPMWR